MIEAEDFKLTWKVVGSTVEHKFCAAKIRGLRFVSFHCLGCVVTSISLVTIISVLGLADMYGHIHRDRSLLSCRKCKVELHFDIRRSNPDFFCSHSVHDPLISVAINR
ncbi:hypothetical protein ACHAW5_004907 [Stephanodiscus triporus]|uniref:Uncharacterized protein n=1 Tax=Stephanodiscus triporus TaxID=2934178 RepID=A0ABD3NZL8_9STRA